MRWAGVSKDDARNRVRNREVKGDEEDTITV